MCDVVVAPLRLCGLHILEGSGAEPWRGVGDLVELPAGGIAQGEETRGGEGSKVKMEAIFLSRRGLCCPQLVGA